MVTHARQTTDEGDHAEAVAAVLAAGDPRGWTATEIATTLDLALDVRDVQRNLEGLVARAQLMRHGIGREALYTLPPRADRPDASARGGETRRHGTQRTRGVVAAPLEGAGACPRLAAEMRALVALAAALRQHEHAVERAHGQPERRRHDRPWAARSRDDTADPPAARTHVPAATSA